MNDIIGAMANLRNPKNRKEYNDAVREAAQQTILYGLSRIGFFDRATMVGGTALRIFHGLDRYSEDLDFILNEPDADFPLDGYLDELGKVLSKFEMGFEISVVEKTNTNNIKAGMVSAHTRDLVIKFFDDRRSAEGFYPTQMTKIKLEIDTDTVPSAKREMIPCHLPYPYAASVGDMPTLFAGKIHAVLCRGWKNRTKGRDLYDYMFFIGKRTPVNHAYLRNKLIKSGYKEEDLSADGIRSMLKKKFAEIDYGTAKADVIAFLDIDASERVEQWHPELFVRMTDDLIFEKE